MVWMMLMAVGCGDNAPAPPPGPFVAPSGAPTDAAVTVEAAPAAPRGPPPIGEGPWNVRIGEQVVGRIFGFEDDTNNQDWMQYVERRKGRFQWAGSGVTWLVTVGMPTRKIACVDSASHEKCQAFELTRTSSTGPTVVDQLGVAPTSVEYANKYHDNGVYTVIATIAGMAPKPEARMYVAPGASEWERKQVVCASDGFRWAERDDPDDPDDKTVTLEIAHLSELPPTLPETVEGCPEGFRSNLFTYTVNLALSEATPGTTGAEGG